MNYERVAHFFARMIIGVLFVLAGVNNTVQFQHILQALHQKGVPIAVILVLAMVVIQFLAGVALILGFKLRIASIALLLVLIAYAVIFIFYWHPAWMSSWENNQVAQNIGIFAALLLLSCSKGNA